MNVDEEDALEALRDLVEQIRLSEFRDGLGHRIEMNQAYRDALALLIARGLVKA